MNHTRLPNMLHSGVFIPQEGNVSVIPPQGEYPGLFSTSDGEMALGYGILGLEQRYGFPLSFAQVHAQHGVRPEWWHAALLHCSRSYMTTMGEKIPQPSGKEPPFEKIAEWARFFFLHPWQAPTASRQTPAASKDPRVALASDFIAGAVRAIVFSNPAVALSVVKRLQDIFDQDWGNPKEQQKGDQEEDRTQEELPRELQQLRPLAVRYNDSLGRWGHMVIEKPPLAVPIREAINALRLRPGYSGAFRYPLRAAIPAMDGRAFGQRKRLPGGTLLIDFSGSMQINSEQIAEVVRQRPAATVATYQGEDGNNAGAEGWLRIIARRGRMEGEIKHYCGNNLIDGPALDWLGKQARPRAWISDGMVTGIGGFTSNLLLDARNKVRKYRVKQFLTLDEYLAAKPNQLRP